ncbi:hypothetical protein [Criblamydia sequanensis]|uniref:ATP:guanido phosphotransferase n=1 Tax=Candidatus Criblamydia sequanensis CRIB-18 TaxID=1437425 RepID=A0A090CZ89_9BACT|nr:hypothetical protein [Criblamydia sequanensis]CDR34257.1 Putative ATP:guanido phosphotransferase [Criblamydia sequanensis CRIB-18]
MKDSVKPRDMLLEKSPWRNNSNKIWLASSLCLKRNVEKFNFPPRLSGDRQKAIVTLIGKEILKEDLDNPVLFKADKMDPLDKEYLTEHFLTTSDFHHAHAGEAFIVDHSSRFLTTLNIHDHIQFRIINVKSDPEKSLNELIKIESAVGKTLKYAYSPRFGFLTSHPEESGTGMEMSIYIQVPALIHTGAIDATLDKIMDDSIEITGLHGSPTEIIGDLLVLKNQYSLAVTEETILSSLHQAATRLTLEENSARSKIKQKENPEIKDRVSRAFGILIHSYQIEALEALNAISLIKLGVDFDWIKGISNESLNELFLNCRRAHLICCQQTPIQQEEVGHARAGYIHKALEKVELLI